MKKEYINKFAKYATAADEKDEDEDEDEDEVAKVLLIIAIK